MNFYKGIKKYFLIIITTIFLLTSVSCNFDNNFGVSSGQNYNVTFIYNDDNNTTSINPVKNNETISMPTKPAKNNYEFDGWYTDTNFVNMYDFSTKVKLSFKLYAKWDVDYLTLTNTITDSIMKANVTIINKSYNTFLFIETNSFTCSGSGIIFYLSENNNYFALTNNHVTVLRNGYSQQKFTVTDYLGNEYTATKLHQSADYDLAVVYFQKNKELKIIETESKNLNSNADIISLGQPKGQSNAITYGKIVDYKTITLKDTGSYESNVTFNVIAHDAPIASGSSGGAILSLNLKIAGINYAASTNSNNEFVQGYAIPVEKINEYLKKYIYK